VKAPAAKFPLRPDLEQAQQVAGEESQQHHHEDEEQRLLELDAPADRAAGGLEGNQAAGENEEGEQDTRCRGQEPESDLAAAGAPMADDREDFQRQHRQHAGHDVQDQAAEQR
jgi:hypothetical protein